jgi:hypothetical protein
MSLRLIADRPHPTAGWRTWNRYLTGEDLPDPTPAGEEPLWGKGDTKLEHGVTELNQRGWAAGHQDVMNKQPVNWEQRWHAEYGVLDAEDSDHDLREVFRKAYMDGYGAAMVNLDKVQPGAAAQLQMVNLQEGLKIDRDIDPAAFTKWEQDQAQKIHGLDMESILVAQRLGLAALAGMTVAGVRAYRPHPHATAGWRTWHRYMTGVVDSEGKVVSEITPTKQTPWGPAGDPATLQNALQDINQRGYGAGHEDVMQKAPVQWEQHWHRMFGALEGEDDDHKLSETFRKAYMDGYGTAVVNLEKVMPAAAAQIQLLNLKEGTKIDRDIDPELFARWEREQAQKIKGVDLASLAAASELGLAALAGMKVV